MTKTICTIIAFYFVAKETIPFLSGLVLELIYYMLVRRHTPTWCSLRERNDRIREKDEQRKKETQREVEKERKGPIGFRSDHIES